MQAVAVGRLDEHEVCAVDIGWILDNGLVALAEIPREDELRRLALLGDPELDDG